MQTMSEYLQIGEFALLAGVSVKTLRFYCDRGLLKPASTDPHTGYRYFKPRQIADVSRILNLREAGISLNDIRKTLDESNRCEAVAGMLERQRLSLLKERAAVKSRLRIVDSLMASLKSVGPEALAELRVVSIEPEFVYSKRAIVDHFGVPVTALFEEGERIVAEAGARAKRPPFLIIHDPENTTAITVEACIPVTDKGASTLPATLVSGESVGCSLTYSGSYEQTAPLREQLKTWLKQAGLHPSGSLREVYHRFGAKLDGYQLPKRVLASSPKGYVTELLMAARPASDFQQ